MKIAIFRALKLGDLLCCVPALRALRTTYPTAHIALIGLPWAQEFTKRFDKYIDEFIEFPGFPGLPEREYNLKDILKFLKKMQRKKFDLLLQMHGKGTITNRLVSLLGAAKTAGFYTKGNSCPDPQSFIPYPESLPEIKRLLSLLKFLGVNIPSEDLEFPILPQDKNKLKKIFNRYDLRPHKYICIHPGSISGKSWNPLRFIKIADTISDWGFKIVFTGIKKEKNLIQNITRQMKSKNVVELAGKTDLGTLAALLKNTHLLICNDTGISHLADALKIPSVVVFTTSDPRVWAPFNHNLHRAITKAYDTKKILQEIISLRRINE